MFDVPSLWLRLRVLSLKCRHRFQRQVEGRSLLNYEAFKCIPGKGLRRVWRATELKIVATNQRLRMRTFGFFRSSCMSLIGYRRLHPVARSARTDFMELTGWSEFWVLTFAGYFQVARCLMQSSCFCVQSLDFAHFFLCVLTIGRYRLIEIEKIFFRLLFFLFCIESARLWDAMYPV